MRLEFCLGVIFLELFISHFHVSFSFGVVTNMVSLSWRFASRYLIMIACLLKFSKILLLFLSLSFITNCFKFCDRKTLHTLILHNPPHNYYSDPYILNSLKFLISYSSSSDEAIHYLQSQWKRTSQSF